MFIYCKIQTEKANYIFYVFAYDAKSHYEAMQTQHWPLLTVQLSLTSFLLSSFEKTFQFQNTVRQPILIKLA